MEHSWLICPTCAIEQNWTYINTYNDSTEPELLRTSSEAMLSLSWTRLFFTVFRIRTICQNCLLTSFSLALTIGLLMLHWCVHVNLSDLVGARKKSFISPILLHWVYLLSLLYTLSTKMPLLHITQLLIFCATSIKEYENLDKLISFEKLTPKKNRSPYTVSTVVFPSHPPHPHKFLPKHQRYPCSNQMM